MKIKNKIKDLIDELIAVHLTKGVQPSELAEAIFEENYQTIEIVNKKNSIQAVVTFLDLDDISKPVPVTMRYTYDCSKKLMRVEQKIGKGRYKTQWDRLSNIDNLIVDLSTYLSTVYDSATVHEILDRLPLDIRNDLGAHLKLAA